MPKVCSYPNPRCFNQQKTSSNFIFHSLPRDPELLRLWLTAMSMNDAESPRTTLLSRDVRVCGEHFSPEDYRAPTRGQLKSKLLKSFAVPFTFVVPGGLPETTQQVNGTAKHSSGSETNCAVMGAPVSADSVTLELLKAARATVRASPLGVIETPMIPWSQTTLPPCVPCNIHIKLENLQRTGSFKIRGVANQFARREKGGHFVTMSAGNYGKSFAYASKHYGSKGKVVMPETAPTSRSTLIQSFGVEVERVPTSCLMDTVNRCVQENNMTFLHSYDDLDLIAGHASLGFEVLEKMGEPDVVVVCCGGGGLLAGVAAAIKLSGCHHTRIYGVEPEGACTMYRSFIENQPVGMDTKSIASGLAPPFAGAIPYELCKRFVEAIVLVSDEELKTAVSTLYKSGLVVEPSGSAAFAAIVNNKIPNMENKNVVCILSGGNIGKDELTNFPD